ncbi:MAG: RNA-binding protein [Candidatus Woesearchaeota archaeon]
MRKQLSKSEIKQLNEDIKKFYCIENFIEKKSKAEYLVNEQRLLMIDGEPTFFYYGDLLVPTLKFLLKNNFLKKITVDMGAVKFVAEGADIMRPGIIAVDEGINKNDFVAIIDQKNQKPLAVGQALFESHELRAQTAGKVVKNIHHVGDELWNCS